MEVQGPAMSKKFLKVQRSPPCERQIASLYIPYNKNAGKAG